VIVRRARPQDWPTMRKVFRAAGAAAWMHIIPRLDELEPPRRWRNTIESENPR
jgi:hypothetical protein